MRYATTLKHGIWNTDEKNGNEQISETLPLRSEFITYIYNVLYNINKTS